MLFLLCTLRNVLSGKRRNEGDMLNKRLILIVDDNQINRKVLSNILKDKYRLIQAENGQEALDILSDRKGEVSAIFLDLTMPVMDGYEFLKVRQRDEELLSIPVLVQTQKEGVDAEIRCLKDGASDFLTKPYNPQLLLHRLENIITLRENKSFIAVVQHDTLTGLYNTEGFYVKAEEIIKNNPDKQFSIICGDINQFKIITQIYGESASDEVLQFVANVLRKVLGPDALIARFSADRFQALIDYQIVAVAVGKQIEELLQESEISNILRVQLGVYTMDKSKDNSVRMMCDYSRMPIKVIKGQYGKTVAFFNKTDYEKVIKEQRIVSQMDSSLKNREFVVYFQPKIEVESGKLIGAESLVRWIHPEDGFMNPGLFIPMFEKNGFITKLDKYVWEETCRHQRMWIDQGYKVVPISVNVSRNDIYSDDLVGFFKSLIAKYRLPASLLHLEITETAYTQGQDKLIAIIKELSALGFYVEMDDFGSGYSSLNMLSEVPVDMLKLDMVFMMNRAKSTSKKSIIHLVMGIAGELDLDVIAEGVETLEDVNYLKTVGCRFAQGYFYERPIPDKEFVKLLTKAEDVIPCTVKHITFSPNGTTLKAGSYLAKKLGNETLYNVTLKDDRSQTIVAEKEELVLISFPAYAGRIPSLFANFLKQKVELNGAKVIFMVSYGNREFDDCLVEGYDIVEELGGSVIGATSVVTQHCYTDKVGTDHPNEDDFNVLHEFSQVALGRMDSNKVKLDLPGNRPYRDGVKITEPYYMPVKDKDKCVECGICEDVCPTKAMTTKDPSECIHCCACMNACGAGALSMKDERHLNTVKKLEANCQKIKETKYY